MGEQVAAGNIKNIQKSEPRKRRRQRGYSSVGRAPALQAGGQGFESLYLHSG